MKTYRQSHSPYSGFRLFLLIVPLLIVILVAVGFSEMVANAQTFPTVSFETSTLTVEEDAGTILVNVILSAAYTDTVTVDYETFEGTGSAGEDYVNTNGTLSYSPGTMTRTIPVTILDNSEYVSTNRFFYLELSNPMSATLGTHTRLKIVINNNDAAPAPTNTPGGVIYVDGYEPNDVLSQSYTVAANQVGAAKQKLCSITMWPIGDVDYFRFRGKPGSLYKVFTLDLTAGLDTYMTVYNTQGTGIAANDDISAGNRRSEVIITADVDGFYYIRIVNQDPSDPANKTYCLQIDEQEAPTATPSPTPIPGDNTCGFNSTIDTACLIGDGQVINDDFVPTYGSLQDSDYFKLWIKPGINYTCETSNLSSVNDTNIILYDHNGNAFNPPIGNDDQAIGDFSSKVEYRASYTGWLYVLVGPVNPPPYEQASLYTYSLQCVGDPATPTPTPTATATPFVGGGSGGGNGGGSLPTAAPTATPFEFPTPFPTPTPFDISLLTPVVPTPPVVIFQPLPTAVPAPGEGGLVSTINVTAFYDENDDFTPELNEGITDVAVALYDSGTGELLAFGYTNEAGMIRFDSIAASGALRVVVPYLNYTQIVTSSASDILIRVAPLPMPGGIQ